LVATVLVVVAWIVFDADWVQTWAPNVAAELGGAFVTVALVDLILRRQRRPLTDAAAQRIRGALENLLRVAVAQRLQLNPDVEQTDDVTAFLREWQEELETQLPERAWLTNWSENLRSIQPTLDSNRDRYESVLDEPLVAAMDDFSYWCARASGDLRWLLALDEATDQTAPWLPRYLEQFAGGLSKLIEVVHQYERQFGDRITIADQLWADARAVAPRMPVPDSEV
jgi:hypothetical protein